MTSVKAEISIPSARELGGGGNWEISHQAAPETCAAFKTLMSEAQSGDLNGKCQQRRRQFMLARADEISLGGKVEVKAIGQGQNSFLKF